MGLLGPKCRTQHFTLLQLRQLALAHQASLFRSTVFTEPSDPSADQPPTQLGVFCNAVGGGSQHHLFEALGNKKLLRHHSK